MYWFTPVVRLAVRFITDLWVGGSTSSVTRIRGLFHSVNERFSLMSQLRLAQNLNKPVVISYVLFFPCRRKRVVRNLSFPN